MSLTASVLAAWIVVWVATPAHAALNADREQETQTSKLRPLGEAVGLLREGLRRSATLRVLVADLETSDLRIWIIVSADEGAVRGATGFVAAAGGVRMLIVVVNSVLLPDDRLAVLAHELQHAREVGAVRTVVDQRGMRRLFEKLGHRLSPDSNYETNAAQLIERQVRNEVAANR